MLADLYQGMALQARLDHGRAGAASTEAQARTALRLARRVQPAWGRLPPDHRLADADGAGGSAARSTARA
ncbi:hypothetical protein [Streptomyces sp. NPDC051567]|uniref:hypothetical protein n=1 Tax=Streptomyces sp. NPDC051567 TaxID=3365660 RepID=UPI0037B3CEFC